MARLPYSNHGGASDARRVGKVAKIVYMSRDQRQLINAAARHLGVKDTQFMLDAILQAVEKISTEIPKEAIDSEADSD